HIRLQLRGNRDGLFPIGCLRDYLALGREQHPQRLAKDPMVIGEQHANPPVIFHHEDSGISATTVERPARDSTVKLPPINSSRSRTPARPVPSPLMLASMPQPSSVTERRTAASVLSIVIW